MKIGIDLGSTNTLAAFMNVNNTPELIPDHRFNDSSMTPSVVHVAGETCVVGTMLERIAVADHHIGVTRHAGHAMGEHRHLFTDTRGKEWTPERISAQILRKIRQDAEIRLSQGIDAATIAIPASFDSTARIATQAAAAMAGFAEVELVEAPVAAAASFSFSRDARAQTLFVYDLGGSTFDATVVRVSADGLSKLSTTGSRSLGGQAFDDAIIDEIEKVYASQSGKTSLSIGAREQLTRFAIHAKAGLNLVRRPAIHESLLIDGQVIDLCFSYQHLCHWIHPLLDETLELSDECVARAGLEWGRIDGVLLVGGCSQLPGITEKLARLSGKRAGAISLYQPHEAIAYGAAILGEEAVSDSGMRMSLSQQIARVNLGIGVLDRDRDEMVMEPLIERDAPLPKLAKRLFYTNRRQQQELVIQLLQSKTGTSDFERLEDFTIGPIGNERENEPVEVVTTLGRDGIVRCEASTASQSVVNVQTIGTNQRAFRLEKSDFANGKFF